ncbi:myosin heavy chain, muscle isoform X3 [Scaptodrosophila lebanonensis]|uniref:Myosin heavy chain, muscle isoform X3 n=1 Tax=Drosophila lebanonensis TaxID=7225 RepID=A0A6J2U295_DROLE|nr:myosin heavy chain, muscle isoform X3 [Scaptodrosophila lebanonensis]
MSHIKDTELKSFKNRSGSKKLGVASCPSNISTRSLPNQIPGTKVFIDSIERKTEGDRSKPKLGRPRMNLVTQQRMNRLKALSPEKMIKCKATTPLQLYQKQHKSRSLSQSALTQKQNCCTRGLESNRVRALESQHKKLQYLQSDFMNKLRMLGPLDLCKLRGRYKFVTLVINGECKLVVHEDDLLRLPKNLPIESVNDLKERCRTVVESGFMLLYEHMSHIQLAKNEMEAQIIREQISQKLKALVNGKISDMCNEIQQLCGSPGACVFPDVARLYREISEVRSQKQLMEAKYFEAKKEQYEKLSKLEYDSQVHLSTEVSKREKRNSELESTIQNLEEQVTNKNLELAEKNAMLMDKNEDNQQLKVEINLLSTTNQRLQESLMESDFNLQRAYKVITKNDEDSKVLEGELKEARELIVNLQKRPDVVDHGIVEKDLIIVDLKRQVKNLEQHKNLLTTQVNNTLKERAVYEDLQRQYDAAVENITILMQYFSELQIQLKGNEYKLDSQPPIAQKLQEQLRKADIQIAHLQEQAERDRQVLAVRCEMINAMQQHEHDNRNKLDELYYQISEKNTLISQINNHLFLKNEEFLNLFGTLSSKQMEVRRAEHIIKLLEENNVRTSLLRIKQEERNALMQDEIAHLKRTIISGLRCYATKS